MKRTIAALLSVVALAGAATATPALAGTLNWDFYSLTGSPAQPGVALGTTQTFYQGGFSLFAESATSPGCSVSMSSCDWSPGFAQLYAKNGGSADEQGLGLTGDPSGDHEIYYPNGIYLNLSEAGGHATSVMIGSIQGSSTNGESWAVYGSNNGSSWTLLGHGMGGMTADFNAASLGGYNQLIVSDPSGTPYTNSNDVVLMSITTSSVPEPGTLALFAAGLLGCVLFVSRRRARQE